VRVSIPTSKDSSKVYFSWQKAGEDRRLVICRPGVVYGPGDPGNVLRMIRAIQSGLFVLPGKRDVRKSYAYVYGLVDSFAFTISLLNSLISPFCRPASAIACSISSNW
jgi:nucleoside-diphosphate-sugar epimerase